MSDVFFFFLIGRVGRLVRSSQVECDFVRDPQDTEQSRGGNGSGPTLMDVDCVNGDEKENTEKTPRGFGEVQRSHRFSCGMRGHLAEECRHGAIKEGKGTGKGSGKKEAGKGDADGAKCSVGDVHVLETRQCWTSWAKSTNTRTINGMKSGRV